MSPIVSSLINAAEHIPPCALPQPARFTSEEAFDARDEGESIYVSVHWAIKQCRDQWGGFRGTGRGHRPLCRIRCGGRSGMVGVLIMANMFDYTCPKCGDGDQLDIQAALWVRLTVDGTDADESGCGDHKWTNDSPCECKGCDWAGTVGQLIDEEGNPVAELNKVLTGIDEYIAELQAIDAPSKPSPVAVPFAPVEQSAHLELSGARDIIARLVEWCDHMGGWEAPVWDDAKAFLDENAP